MADGDFGGWLFGGDTGGATTSIVGGNYIPDFGGSVGASGFFEPTAFATDFGAFSNFTNDFNNYVATQAPTLFMAYDTTIPPSPVLNELRDQIPAILAQQDQIKTLATSLNNVTGKLQQDYTNYSNVYNQNIKPYNDTMATYNQYIRYRDQTQPGSYLWNRHNSNANQKLNEANTYVKTINDAASKYETDYKTYQTEVKALEDSVNTYKDTFNTFKAFSNNFILTTFTFLIPFLSIEIIFIPSLKSSHNSNSISAFNSFKSFNIIFIFLLN